jgi:pentatricopeptide repeat protein
MQARVKGIGTILTNTNGNYCAAKLRNLCKDAEYKCQLDWLEEGRCVHQEMIENGLESSIFVGSSLGDMYGKCGSIEDAWKVFHKLPSRHVVVTRTATVLGHVNVGKGRSNV